MPLVKTISKYLPGWSQRQRPQSGQNQSTSPRAHDISDQPRRAQTSGERDAIISPIERPVPIDIEHFGQTQDTYHSYARGPRIPQGSRLVRSQLPLASSQSGSGMSRCLGISTQMPKRDRSLDAQADERRLFPEHDTHEKRPDEVRIIPGMAGHKKRIVPAPLKPVNRLSTKARESGPVRAQGIDRRQAFGHNNYSPSSLSLGGNYAGFGDIAPPAKRRRHETPAATPNSVIDLEKDDLPDTAALVRQYSPRISPTPSQHSAKSKKALAEKRASLDEYRQHFPLDDEYIDVFFTENAAKQRRSLASQTDADRVHPERPNEATAKGIFDRVEIRKSGDTLQEPVASQSPTLPRRSVGTDGKRRTFDTRESPDELQGAATVPPAPSSLAGTRKGDVGTRSEGLDRTETGDHRLSSPTDIRPTTLKSPSHQEHGKPGQKRSRPQKRKFKAISLRFGSFERVGSEEQPIELLVDEPRKTIGLSQSAIGPGIGPTISLDKVRTVLQGDHPSCKIRLKLSKVEGSDEKIDIDLSSPDEKGKLCTLLSTLLTNQRTKLQYKASQWMDNAFAISKKNANRRINGAKRPSTESVEEMDSLSRVEVPKRPKLSASLQEGNSVIGQKSPTTKSAPQESSSTTPTSPKPSAEISDRGAHTHPSRKDSNDGISIPVKRFSPKSSSNRETRSMSRRAQPTFVCDDDDDDTKSQPVLEPDHDVKSKKWKKPLVYPRLGKKKAEVDFHDRERLRDNEFLNDNLIGFYTRFLEDHLDRTNQDVAKRVYFFNSYFFATLTNLPRGKSGINYEGVQKWTRNVDIFSYDYIVVPINEAAHWYLAIICNLPAFQPELNKSPEPEKPQDSDDELPTQPEDEVREIRETPEATSWGTPGGDTEAPGHESQPEQEETTRETFASMTLSDTADNDGDGSKEGDWPEGEQNPVDSRAKFFSPRDKTQEDPSEKEASKDVRETARSNHKATKSKKKTQSSFAKNDPQQPIILTFDSLDLPRSSTISILRGYLYEEANSKRGKRINTRSIKGMKARGIPLQPNFSDCGLYLLAYVEKFVQNPDLFVTKILRKQMDVETDWPLLKSGILRHRFRRFLDELYDEQDQIRRQKSNEKNTMADRRVISYLLGSPEPSQVEIEEQTVQEDTLPEQQTDGEVAAQKGPEEAYNTGTGASRKPAESDAPISKKKRSKVGKIANEASTGESEELASKEGAENLKSVPSEDEQAEEPRRKVSAKIDAGQEVIEVPDSQEPEVAKADMLKTGRTKTAPSRPERVKEEMGRNQDTAPSSRHRDREHTPQQDYAGSVRVEVQIPGTPPPGDSMLAEDAVRRSPRHTTTKRKDGRKPMPQS